MAASISKTVLECSLPFLRSSDPNSLYSILTWLGECFRENSLSDKEGSTPDYTILQDNYHTLLDKSNHLPYITVLKLNVLEFLVSADNVGFVVDNIKSIIHSRAAVGPVIDRAVQFLLNTRVTHAEVCQKAIEDVLATDQLDVHKSLLKHLHRLTNDDFAVCDRAFDIVLPNWSTLNTEELNVLLNMSSKLAFKRADNVEYMMEIVDYVLKSSSNCRACIKCALLHSLTLCFKAEPAEYLPGLRRCLAELEKDENMLVREQVRVCASKLHRFISPQK